MEVAAAARGTFSLCDIFLCCHLIWKPCNNNLTPPPPLLHLCSQGIRGTLTPTPILCSEHNKNLPPSICAAKEAADAQEKSDILAMRKTLNTKAQVQLVGGIKIKILKILKINWF